MAKPPVAVVCVGMAGSGKTTFMQRINSHLYSKHQPPYVLNLDPAVHSVPFESNIDIRDSINYKEVMKQYNLGPNGGILTSLNLFATKVDQILSILEKRTLADPAQSPLAKRFEHILVDTPGQIEVFVWSASGSILLESLASSFPTVIAYVIDTPRTCSTSTFMSNMLYACSILYKTKLPMILVFNKTDVKDAEFAKEWMSDFEAFQAALREEEEGGAFGGAEGGAGGMGSGSGYMGSYLNSMSLMLEEFYRHLSVVGVSSMTGQGIDEFFDAVEEKRKEFERDYRPELEKKRSEREKEKETRRDVELGKLLKDMNITTGKKTSDPQTVSDIEEEDNDDDTDEDADEEPASGKRDDAGLSQRYKAALESSETPGGERDESFTRYIRSGNDHYEEIGVRRRKSAMADSALEVNSLFIVGRGQIIGNDIIFHQDAATTPKLPETNKRKLLLTEIQTTFVEVYPFRSTMDVFYMYTYGTGAWLSLQALPLIASPKMIVAILLDKPREPSELEIYFARSFGFALITLAILSIVLTGTIPLTSNYSISSDESDPKAPYAVPTLLVTSIFHAIAAFYAYTFVVWGGGMAFMIAIAAYGGLSAIARVRGTDTGDNATRKLLSGE
ncbi:hypothetical protein LOZ58_005834 [Ophidiomyces ophidiicola]|nr:hypothetical protein LOZ58_005834 [Ophidiomyces ophidiicola]